MRFNAWLRTNRHTIVILGILVMLCYENWKHLSPFNDHLINYLQHNPDGYRLWTQFLIMFDQHPIAYVALTAIIFIPVAWYLYLGSPKDSRFMMFAWLVFLISQASIRQSPAYILLALAIILSNNKWSCLIVVPMTIVKEHAGLVYIIYLIATKRYRTAVIAGVLWGLTFFTIQFLVGYVPFYTNPDTGLSLIPPFLILAPYINILTIWKFQLFIVAEILLCVMFLNDRTEVFMVLANLPIIVFFGLFYEPQLWFMVMVAIIFRRKSRQEEISKEN